MGLKVKDELTSLTMILVLVVTLVARPLLHLPIASSHINPPHGITVMAPDVTHQDVAGGFYVGFDMIFSWKAQQPAGCSVPGKSFPGYAHSSVLISPSGKAVSFTLGDPATVDAPAAADFHFIWNEVGLWRWILSIVSLTQKTQDNCEGHLGLVDITIKIIDIGVKPERNTGSESAIDKIESFFQKLLFKRSEDGQK